MPDTVEGTVQVILVSQERTQERIEGKITDDLVPQLTEVYPFRRQEQIEETVKVISS